MPSSHLRRAAVAVLILTTACSGGGAQRAVPSPAGSAAQTPTPAATTPPPSATPAPTPSALGAAGGPVPAAFKAVSVTFISTETGWALGTGTCAKPPCTGIVRTRDGGQTWRGIPAPAAGTNTGDGSVSTRELRFADQLNGFAFASSLFATHDGGGHWRRIAVKGSVASLEVAGGRFWAVLHGCDSVEGTCTAPGSVITGAVGGDAVTTVMPLAPGVTGQVVLHGPLVYLALARLNQQSTAPQLKVASGGGSFAARPIPCGSTEVPYLAAAGDTSLALVCQSSDAGAGQQPKHYYGSTDSGRTWTRRADPAGLIGTVVAATGSAVFVGNQRTGLQVSRDGGRTWATSLASEAGTSYVGFVDDSFGEAVVGDALELTRDAGRTWARVRFS